MLDRRQFVGRSLALVGAAGLGALGGAEAERASYENSDSDLSSEALAERAEQGSLAAAIPFDAPHQAGILTPAPAQATFAALDAIAPDRQTLAEALQQLSTRARQLTQGAPIRCSRPTTRPPTRACSDRSTPPTR